MNTPSSTLLDELDAANLALETASPHEVLTWTFDRFGDGVSMACSFEDLALLHMVRAVAPQTQIVFLDTGGHFVETLDFAARMEREWSLNLARVTPGPDAEAWPCGTERCCELRKVAPLQRALEGRSAWVTAVKRVDATTRADVKIVAWDQKFGLVKVNPLATWSDDDLAYYLRANSLAEHPLWSEGYASIGCAAVTTKLLDPANRRSGRWAGADKEECGLHEA
jgi:phosphoadenosine phosphosulfate reductase